MDFLIIERRFDRLSFDWVAQIDGVDAVAAQNQAAVGIGGERALEVRFDEFLAVDEETPPFGDASETLEGFDRKTVENLFDDVVW